MKVGGAVKAPDYGFRIGGQPIFFSKPKPSVQIKTDISPAYQLRRYAWSARLPLSILSDFEGRHLRHPRQTRRQRPRRRPRLLLSL
ncbi:MAG: hypothetical protein U1G05_17435 [Kiritimatiellia bacterium]